MGNRIYTDGVEVMERMEELGAVYHHHSKVPGYVKKGQWLVEAYKGRFGVGYRVYSHYPDWRGGSCRYCTYYLVNRRGE